MSFGRVMVLLGVLLGATGLMMVPLALANSAQSKSVCQAVDAAADQLEDNCAMETKQHRSREQVQLPAPAAVNNGFEIFAGTGIDNLPVENDPHLIDVSTNLSMTALVSVSIGGATYDPFGDRVLFTSSTVNEHEADLWEWISGTMTATLLGIIRTPDGDLSIDGLAMSEGLLFGVHQVSTPAGPEGLYQISLDTFPNTDTIRATQVFTWTPSERSINGIDADPRNGRIYALDDTTTSTLEILLDGTFITVTSYFTTAETDLDGLAIGDNGRAYLIPDDNDPGDIYVYNLDTGVYEAPLRSPWTGSDSASGGAFFFALPPSPQPGVLLTKTVGTDPAICATTSTITMTAGTEATYCFTITNSGEFTLTEHTLVDDVLGSILVDFQLPLGPGQSVWVTQTAIVTQTTVNTAMLTAATSGTVYLDPLTDTISTTLAVIPQQFDSSPWATSQNRTASGPGLHDITEVVIGYSETDLLINMTFLNDVSPGNSGLPNALVGYVDLDTDQNRYSGVPGIASIFCPNPTDLGVDYTIDLFSYANGMAPIVSPFGLTTATSATVTFSGQSMSIQVPLHVIRDTGNINVATVVGDLNSPTDCAPNGGSISSSPAGTATGQDTATVFTEIKLFLPIVIRE